MPHPYPILPTFFEFRSLSWPLKAYYLATLIGGIAIAKLLSGSPAGKTAVVVGSAIAALSLPALHWSVYYNKGNPDRLPTNDFLVNLTMNVGGILTLLYTFTGFLLTGIGSGVALLSSHPAVWLGSGLLVLSSIWLVPYSVWLMWK